MSLFFKLPYIAPKYQIQPSAEWGNITAEDLGTGGTGSGTLFLADDGTFKAAGGAAAVDDIRLHLKLSQLTGYKAFSYSGDSLSQINIYTDNAMTVKLFQVDFTYTGDNLTLLEVERISDSFMYSKTFTYDGSNNLTAIEIT